ncbi:MAG: hypothetical protein J6Z22_10315 [Lachnospiraceae bacterium]|nr:hypothetical protein [Lachnospiraceae bacterium]
MIRRKFMATLAGVLAAGMLLSGCAIGAGDKGGEESSILVTSEESKESTPTPVPTVEPKEDWSGKYDDYFELHPFQNLVMDVEMEEEGYVFHMRYYLGQTDTMNLIRYAVWARRAGKEIDASQELNAFTAYFTFEGEAYLQVDLKGKKTEYYHGVNLAKEDLDQITQSESPVELGDDTTEDTSYDREEVIDGVTYDVLVSRTLRKTKSKANRWVYTYFYINRETQQLEKMVEQDSTKQTICYITPFDTTEYQEVPNELRKAKKLKEHDFEVKFAVSFLRLTLNVIGVDPDQYDFEAYFDSLIK